VTAEEQHWALAQKRLETATELRRDLIRMCPDSRATSNCAARAALRTAAEIIEMNPLREFEYEWEGMHWAGVIEAAIRIISAVEMEMYDPRSYPERYEKGGESGGS
jgi:hypothetical protein